MGLEDYDLYAIKSYSFTVRKTNSFFSLPTVLLSLSVFVIAVAINFNTVKHLWLPLDELEIISSSSIELPEALTSTIVCVKPSTPSNKDRFMLFRADKLPIQFKRLSEEQIGVAFPELKNQIGSGFGCADLEGFRYSNASDYLYVEVQDPSATIYLKTNSIDQVLRGKTQAAKTFTATGTSSTQVFITYLKCVIYNKLYLNYDPEVTNTFMSNTLAPVLLGTNLFNNSFTNFRLTLYNPASYNVRLDQNILVTLQINRKNIGDILGAVLSWVSILALLISFIAAPLMDVTLILLTAQSLYHLEPEMQNPSLLKFMVARIKKGIFPKEDQYVKMCQEIDKMKDINNIVKLQMLFARLMPKTRKKTTQELIASQQNFNQIARAEVGVDLFVDKSQSRPLAIDVSNDQKPQNALSSLKKWILYKLDEGSDAVSITYSKGGIGSKTSFCVSLAAVFGLLLFLIIFGLLRIDTNILRYRSSNITKEHTISSYKLYFSAGPSNPLSLRIVDGNFNTIETVAPAQNGCRDHLSASELSNIRADLTDRKFYCIDRPLKLVSSNDPSISRYLRIGQQETSTTVIFFYLKQEEPNSYFQPISRIVFLNNDLNHGGSYFKIPLMLVQIQAPSVKTEELQVLPSRSFPLYSRHLIGNYLTIDKDELTIKEQSTSFFDGIQNIWTFTVICFTVIVMKITKYVNISQKQQSQNPAKADFRDSICIFLARMNGLLHGRHRQQLEHLKYYVKEPLTL